MRAPRGYLDPLMPSSLPSYALRDLYPSSIFGLHRVCVHEAPRKSHLGLQDYLVLRWSVLVPFLFDCSSRPRGFAEDTIKIRNSIRPETPETSQNHARR